MLVLNFPFSICRENTYFRIFVLLISAQCLRAWLLVNGSLAFVRMPDLRKHKYNFNHLPWTFKIRSILITMMQMF
jgi:hypothetical protein